MSQNSGLEIQYVCLFDLQPRQPLPHILHLIYPKVSILPQIGEILVQLYVLKISLFP